MRNLNKITFLLLCVSVLCTLVVSHIFITGISISEPDKNFINGHSHQVIGELDDLNTNLNKVEELSAQLEAWNDNVENLNRELANLNKNVENYGGIKDSIDEFNNSVDKLEKMAEEIRDHPLLGDR